MNGFSQKIIILKFAPFSLLLSPVSLRLMALVMKPLMDLQLFDLFPKGNTFVLLVGDCLHSELKELLIKKCATAVMQQLAFKFD